MAVELKRITLTPKGGTGVENRILAAKAVAV
jgi:hypothetical protein